MSEPAAVVFGIVAAFCFISLIRETIKDVRK